MSINEDLFLLAIRGTLNASVLDDGRKIHNETAGNPQGVAAARALGDLSHNVYVPLQDDPARASELLILDTWNDLDGLGKFFSDPQVQGGGSMMFKTRDPVVWRASGTYGFVLPAPRARTERFVGVIRGTVTSREAAGAAFDTAARKTINAARMLGQVSHQMFYRVTPPGEPASNELIGLDVWHDAEGMAKFYADTTAAQGLYRVFTAPPVTSIWKQPAGQWVEW
jgi:hypothetical protein